MIETEFRSLRRRGSALLVAGALAAAVLALDLGSASVDDTTASASDQAPAVAAQPAPLAVEPAAAKSAVSSRTVAADRTSSSRASRSSSRASFRPSNAPYRFASKRFNHWYAKRYMAYRYSWHSKQYRCLAVMWGKESAWNEKAHNGSSGAHGIPQAMPGSKMATFGANWRSNPTTQIKWGLSYIRGVYKSPCRAWSFWRSHSWY